MSTIEIMGYCWASGFHKEMMQREYMVMEYHLISGQEVRPFYLSTYGVNLNLSSMLNAGCLVEH